METKAYNYNHATKGLGGVVSLTKEQVMAYLLAPNDEPRDIRYNDKETELERSLVNGFKCCSAVADKADREVKDSGSYPYNSVVAKAMADILGVDKDEQTLSRLEHIVYCSSKYRNNMATIDGYEKMVADGYIPIQDILPEHDRQWALLSGKSEHDWLTIKKDNARVRLVHTADGRIGYQEPRQRTRYQRTGSDCQYFVKLTV